MSYFDGKRVLVAGGAGFIGSHVVEELLRRAPRARVSVTLRPGSSRANLARLAKDVRWISADLLDPRACLRACRGQEAVLDLSGRVEGISYNIAHPGTMFRENMAMALNLLEAARAAGAGRFLVVSSTCVYARGAPVPTPESAGFEGTPEPANEGYGWAKRMAELLGRSYAREFGLEVAIARPYNVYGPRDHYGERHSHVIPALVHRALRGEDPLLVWGDGRATRSFLYVEDAARGLLDVAERHAEAEPLNLGSNEEISMAGLARLIVELTGSGARLRFDRAKPSGQPRRVCDGRKAARLIGFRPRVRLQEGLRRSIDWYRGRLGRSARS